MHDCFGRDRRQSTGRYERCRVFFKRLPHTLYIGGLKTTRYKNKNEGTKAIKNIVERHFSKWGEMKDKRDMAVIDLLCAIPLAH